MRIAIGCDHAGFALKSPITLALEADGHDVLDLGTFSTDPVDYPDFARSVGQAVLRGFVEAGILVCGSGVGASIAANKIRGIRAALCHDLFTARQSREDDDANVLCLGARVLDESTAIGVTRAWLGARFSAEERHVRRVAKIGQLESGLGAPERGGPPAPPPRAATPTPAPPVAAPLPPPPAAPRPAPLPVGPPPPRPRATPPSAAPAPAAPPAAPPPAEARRPAPPPDSLAARAAELIRQFTERHPDKEDEPATPEGVISLGDGEEDSIEVVMPEPRARRPEPRPARPAEPEAKPPSRGAGGEGRAAVEPRTRMPEAPPARPQAAERPQPAERSRPEPAPVVAAAKAPPPKPAEPAPPSLPDAFALPAVEEALRALESNDFLGRIWVKDAGLWNGDVAEIRNRLGWLTAPTIMRQHADDIRTFADEIRRLQNTHVVLLGMGGSSLSTDVFNATFGSKMGFPDMVMLDSTDPGTVKRVLDRVNLGKSIFVVSTKSGTTIETIAFHAFFRDRIDATQAPRPGQQFIAITDPGTPLETLAADAGFRRAFLNPPTIGGRYSALSFFGLVPAAMIGVDIKTLLERAQAMVEACGHEVAIRNNPAVKLGAALAGFARSGRDKVTLIFSEKIRALGPWIEQLLAESLGKDGKGLVPVDGEPLGAPAVYGDDRVFVAVQLESDRTEDSALVKLAEAGHPVIRLTLKDALDVGGEFFRWELATAAAGCLFGVNPFDEPDVTAAKEKTGALLASYRKSRRLPEWQVSAEEDGVALLLPERRSISLTDAIGAHLASARPGDYLALQAYLGPHHEVWSRLQEIRVIVRDRYRLATTAAYGPRYLHSTGQLHKGGAAKGVFIQITADDGEDAQIPGAGYGFSALKAAQALGDLQALHELGRRVIRIHLKGRPLAPLEKLVQIIRSVSKRA